jgi:hypothetical protein
MLAVATFYNNTVNLQPMGLPGPLFKIVEISIRKKISTDPGMSIKMDLEICHETFGLGMIISISKTLGNQNSFDQ